MRAARGRERRGSSGDGGAQHGRGRADHAGQRDAAGEIDRAGHPPVTEHRALLGAVRVDRPTTEPPPQGAGEGGLDLPGVRAGMRPRVAPPHRPGVARATADQRRPRRGQCRGQPRGQQVRDVVEARRAPPEAAVARRPVTHHRIERVRGAVGQQAGCSGQRAPQQRRDHRVRGVLGDRLDAGPDQAGGVEPARVAPAQGRQPRPGGVEVVAIERPRHRGALGRQRGAAQHRPGRQCGRGGLQHGVTAGEPLHRGAGERRATDQQAAVGHAHGPAVGVDRPLDSACEPAESRHRVAPGRVPEHRVRRRSEQQTHRPCRAHWHVSLAS